METVPHTDFQGRNLPSVTLSYKYSSVYIRVQLNYTYLLTLYVWKVFLVLVYLTTKNCESQSLQEHRTLFQLHLSVCKQVE